MVANKRKRNSKAIVTMTRKLLVSNILGLVGNELYHGFSEDIFSRKLKLEKLSAS
ncbi:MAG: hypothetical protein JRN61_04470 [Nitrososphaerota archaeon]|nr:hypothetical protein [Nitrososphaerota archaeon]